MARKKASQPEAQAIPRPDPEAVEKFDALMAEETRKTPPCPRKVGPVDVGAEILRNLILPARATLEFKTRELLFWLPPDEGMDHELGAIIKAGDKAEAGAALDAAIRAAEPEKTWRHEEVAFFLHAVQFSRPKTTEIRLKYIFRLRPTEA